MREFTTKMPGPDGAPWCNPGLNTYRKSPGRVDTPESIASEWVDVGISSNWPSWEVTCRQRPGKGIGHLTMENDPFIDLIYFADLIAYNRIYTYICMHTCRIIPCIYTYSVGYNRIRIRTRLGYKRTYNQINGGFPLRYGNSKGTFCDKPIIYVDDLPINWFVINTY